MRQVGHRMRQAVLLDARVEGHYGRDAALDCVRWRRSVVWWRSDNSRFDEDCPDVVDGSPIGESGFRQSEW